MEFLHAVGQFHVVEELPVDARCSLNTIHTEIISHIL
jgi:hypothetical protein